MTDLKDLARRVSELQGPSREVDREIWYALQDEMEGDPCHAGCFTASLDAAMTLARNDGEAFVMLSDAMLKLEDAGWPRGEWVKQLPRYITAAALIARSEA